MPRGRSTQKEDPGLAAFQEMEGALGELERERGIPRQRLLDVLKDAIARACKKQYGDGTTVRIAFSPSGIRVFRQRRVVPDPQTPPAADVPADASDASEAAPEVASVAPSTEPGPPTDERATLPSPSPGPEANPNKAGRTRPGAGAASRGKQTSSAGGTITLSAARQLNPTYEVDDVVEDEVPTQMLGRIAAQEAKQQLRKELRQTQDTLVYEELKDRVGDIMSGVVQRRDRQRIIIDLGKTEAELPPYEQVRNENYQPGTRLRVYVTNVQVPTDRGCQVTVSRSRPELVKRLFELEVPEIHDGIVEIKAIAREEGQRTKIAVYSRQAGVDPVGACVGPRGQRVQNVVQELRGEKIDIVPWDPNPERFVAAALEPAQVERVLLYPNDRRARVVVPEQKLSLAIGREGQNARLAAKLTGWQIDIKSTSQMAQMVAAELFTPAPSRTPVVKEGVPAGPPAGVPVIPGIPGTSGTSAGPGLAAPLAEPGIPMAPIPDVAAHPLAPPAAETAEEQERRRAREEERGARRVRPRREKEKEVPITKLLEEDVELESTVTPAPTVSPTPTRRQRIAPRAPASTPEQRPLATTLGALLQQKGAALPLLTPEESEKTSPDLPGQSGATAQDKKGKDRQSQGGGPS